MHKIKFTSISSDSYICIRLHSDYLSDVAYYFGEDLDLQFYIDYDKHSNSYLFVYNTGLTIEYGPLADFYEEYEFFYISDMVKSISEIFIEFQDFSKFNKLFSLLSLYSTLVKHDNSFVVC